MSRISVAPLQADDGGSVLVVDDEPEQRAAVRRTLSAAGHTLQEAPTVADALRVLGATPIDVVVLDLGLPDASGLRRKRAPVPRSHAS
ncbi:MAG TPA: response regulator [Polyangiaceae bacterium]|nr:response regulator [Polyangiaceae bacterium]